ncbi:MAG: protease inhibitor I42 family protein [Mycobacterium leprae]
MTRLSFLALLLVALVGCTSTNQVEVTDANNGQTIELEPGQTLMLRLPANASTGYRWSLIESNDTTVLRLLHWEYIQQGERRPGAAGTEVWQFQAGKAGNTGLKLGYARSNPPGTPEKEFSLTIVVKEQKK